MKSQGWNGVNITKIELNISYVNHTKRHAVEHAMSYSITKVTAILLICMKLRICMDSSMIFTRRMRIKQAMINKSTQRLCKIWKQL